MPRSTPPTAARAGPSDRWTKARPLRRSFYNRSAAVVAPALLGCVLLRKHRRSLLAGRIVETEAYVGESDRASHASRGRTPRNGIMYEEPGYAYVYFIYGMYDMLNVVCQPVGVPEAVLIRAVEPLYGIEIMQRRRAVRRARDVANGPGKLCRAFAITRRQNGADLLGPVLWITRGRVRNGENVVHGPRVGVDYAGTDAQLPLRFFIAGNSHVSRARTTSVGARDATPNAPKRRRHAKRQQGSGSAA